VGFLCLSVFGGWEPMLPRAKQEHVGEILPFICQIAILNIIKVEQQDTHNYTDMLVFFVLLL